ncbi:hypothetical protein BDM02DRAFT_3250992, partial [Thelephora ganbajun]
TGYIAWKKGDIQVLAKIPGEPLEDQLIELERVTPHILIGTPQVLLSNYDRLKLHRLNTVVVDEVDYLIEMVPNLPDKFKCEKMRKKIAKYPGPTRHLLDKGSGWLTRGDMHLVKINGTPGKEFEIRNIEDAIASPDPQPVSTKGGETASQPGEDETTANDEGPILLVSTLVNTRGLDLPDLSHVFVMGIPEGRVDLYTHIAGRTGRFGKTGKIVAVVEKIEEEDNDGKGG